MFDRTNPDWVLSLKPGHKKSSYDGHNDDIQSCHLWTKRRAEKWLQIEQNEEEPYSKNKKKKQKSLILMTQI